MLVPLTNTLRNPCRVTGSDTYSQQDVFDSAIDVQRIQSMFNEPFYAHDITSACLWGRYYPPPMSSLHTTMNAVPVINALAGEREDVIPPVIGSVNVRIHLHGCSPFGPSQSVFEVIEVLLDPHDGLKVGLAVAAESFGLFQPNPTVLALVVDLFDRQHLFTLGDIPALKSCVEGLPIRHEICVNHDITFLSLEQGKSWVS